MWAGKMIAAAAFLGLATGAVLADGGVLSLRQGGDGVRLNGTSLAMRLRPWWAQGRGGWRASVGPELEVSRFGASSPDRGSVEEAGAVVLFRLQRGKGMGSPYAELGLGAALFSGDRLAGRNLSTHFQFAELIGVGVQFASGWSVGWRYAHYSNAGIRSPNDGIDIQQVVLSIGF